ncbi:uncharacterized protein LOC124411058 [Diprion similis]|uniref:uncharacterized protein LOC124411058 n=1 Tax=Diprion similis TaxID=362088 RepID=UPI001EF8690A|nr:uncharacterized protein LOC124411058 [Diprion similis]
MCIHTCSVTSVISIYSSASLIAPGSAKLPVAQQCPTQFDDSLYPVVRGSGDPLVRHKQKGLTEMLRKYAILVAAVLLLIHDADAAFPFGSGGRSTSSGVRQYRSNGNYYGDLGSTGRDAAARSSEQGKRDSDLAKGGKGLSAWGIIAIVVGVILVGTGGYYAFVFYPYICKRERSYDMIELTNVL